AHRAHAGGERRLEHVAAQAGVFADDDARGSGFAAARDQRDRAAEPHGQLGRHGGHPRAPSDAVGAKQLPLCRLSHSLGTPRWIVSRPGQSRKLTNCRSSSSSSAAFNSWMASWRSSRFLPVIRTASCWMAACTFSFESLTSLTMCRAFSLSMPSLTVTTILPYP